MWWSSERLVVRLGLRCLLPDEWNQRFVMGGGGGLVGFVQNAARGYANEGYATVGTDTGHQAVVRTVAGH